MRKLGGGNAADAKVLVDGEGNAAGDVVDELNSSFWESYVE